MTIIFFMKYIRIEAFILCYQICFSYQKRSLEQTCNALLKHKKKMRRLMLSQGFSSSRIEYMFFYYFLFLNKNQHRNTLKNVFDKVMRKLIFLNKVYSVIEVFQQNLFEKIDIKGRLYNSVCITIDMTFSKILYLFGRIAKFFCCFTLKCY